LYLPSNQADFLDRVVSFDLKPMPDEQRRVLSKLQRTYRAACPRIMGGLLNTLSKALELLPTTSDAGVTRMTEFHHWGRAFAWALGYRPEDFAAAYGAAIQRQRHAALDNPRVLTVYQFAKQERKWIGEPTELYRRLIDTARANRLRMTPDYWPSSP